MINRDSSNRNRKANELLIIMRLAFLYGCFKRQDIVNILHVKKETLNRQYGLMSQITDYIPAIPDQRLDGRLVKYEDVSGLLDELWNIYNLTVEDIPFDDDRKVQYGLILESLAKGEKKTAREIVRFCQDRIDELECNVKSDDRVLDAAKKELEAFGLIRRDSFGKYCFSVVLEVEEDRDKMIQLREFTHYAMHILYPSLGGHYMWELLGNMQQKNTDSQREIFWFQGYQPQKILDEKTILELQMYIHQKSVVQFEFLDNEESRLGILNESVSQKKNVMPYRILHDIRYGRTYLVGYCLDNQRMRGYRTDRISDIRKSKEKWKDSVSLGREYEKNFSGTWMGGRVIEPSQERKRVRLEILNPQMNEERIRKMGITPQRRGNIQWEGEHCYYEITVPNTRDLKPWVMSLKNKVRVVSVTGEQSGQDYTGQADGLRQEMIRTLKQMAVNYGKL